MAAETGRNGLQFVEEFSLCKLSKEGVSLLDSNLDSNTLWHSIATTLLYADFLEVLGIEPSERLINGALFHDLGKAEELIRILITKKHLPVSAVQIIRTHPEIGYRYVAESPMCHLTDTRIVLLHHEKYDGSGYPYGLGGEEIPLPVQIFTIADAYDAIVSDRPYKPGCSPNKALSKLSSAKGRLFNPELVEVFLRSPAVRDSDLFRYTLDQRRIDYKKR